MHGICHQGPVVSDGSRSGRARRLVSARSSGTGAGARLKTRHKGLDTPSVDGVLALPVDEATECSAARRQSIPVPAGEGRPSM